MPLRGPYGCLMKKPTKQSIKFAGKYISLKQMAALYDMDHGYLSRIFSGQRVPTASYAKRIAVALHMELDDVLAALGLQRADGVERKSA